MIWEQAWAKRHGPRIIDDEDSTDSVEDGFVEFGYHQPEKIPPGGVSFTAGKIRHTHRNTLCLCLLFALLAVPGAEPIFRKEFYAVRSKSSMLCTTKVLNSDVCNFFIFQRWS